MTERPILFNGEMVRAERDGRKTQTRRVVAEQEDLSNKDGPCLYIHSRRCEGGCDYSCTKADVAKTGPQDGWDNLPLCPYGQPGDRLWVRETWGCGCHNSMAPMPGCEINYKASDEWPPIGPWPDYPLSGWRPSIHMFRWASRTTLEVTNIRVERVTDISEADAIAEGAREGDPVKSFNGEPWSTSRYRQGFKNLWNSINSDRVFGWDKSPWVWVVEFKRVE